MRTASTRVVALVVLVSLLDMQVHHAASSLAFELAHQFVAAGHGPVARSMPPAAAATAQASSSQHRRWLPITAPRR